MRSSFQDDTTIVKVTFVGGVCKSSTVNPLVVIKTIPLCGICSIVMLAFRTRSRRKGQSGKGVGRTLIGVIGGPVVSSVFLKLVISLLKVRFPAVIGGAVGSITRLTAPLTLVIVNTKFRKHGTVTGVGPAY